ncbi:MAG: OmpA family protein [Bacteroidetes bacterium]|nr:OmpA family protein [Bacteroidota bacterium]MDA1111298.1 OmpA family protein [Bacteroidota bacterium]
MKKIVSFLLGYTACGLAMAQTFYSTDAKNLEFAEVIHANGSSTQARNKNYEAQHDLALSYLLVQDAGKALAAFEHLQANYADRYNDEDRFYAALAHLRMGNVSTAKILLDKAKANGYSTAVNAFYTTEVTESFWNMESFQTLLDPKAYGAYGLVLAQGEGEGLVALYSANADVLLDRKKSSVFDRPYYALFDSKLGVLQADDADSKKQLYIQDAHRLNPDLATYLHHQPSQYWPERNALLYTQNAEEFNQNNERLFEVYRSDWDGSKWVATSLNINDPNISVSSMVISPNGKLAAFASNGFGSIGQSDIFLADVVSCEMGKFEVTNVRSLGAQINTSLRENFPFFLTDEVLVFSSEGHYGKGGLDLFQFHLQTGEFKRLPGRFNSEYDDFGFSMAAGWISLSSNRVAGTYMDDIYAIQATAGPRNGFDPFVLDEPVVAQNDVKVETPVVKTKPVANPEIRVVNELDGQKVAAFKATFIDEDESDENPMGNAATANTNGASGTPPASGTAANGTGSNQAGNTSGSSTAASGNASGLNNAGSSTNGNTANGANSTGTASGSSVSPAANDPLRKIKMERRGYYSKVVKVRQSVLDTGVVEVQLTPMVKGDLLGSDLGIGPVYYELDRTELDAADKESLDQLARFMKEYSYVVVELRSHTDARASDLYNQNLSMRRTRSALNYMLTKHNLPSSRFRSTWVGETQLAVPCPDGVPCSETQHALNRRTTFHIDRF